MPAAAAVDVRRRPTCSAPVYASKKRYMQLLREHVTHLSALQLLYASNRYTVLLIFQAIGPALIRRAVK